MSANFIYILNLDNIDIVALFRIKYINYNFFNLLLSLLYYIFK